MEKVQHFSILSLDILLQFAPAYGKSLEDPFHGCRRSLLSCYDLCLGEFPRWFKVESVGTRDLVCLGCDDMEVGKCAEGRQGLAAEAEGVKAREVIV